MSSTRCFSHFNQSVNTLTTGVNIVRSHLLGCLVSYNVWSGIKQFHGKWWSFVCDLDNESRDNIHSESSAGQHITHHVIGSCWALSNRCCAAVLPNNSKITLHSPAKPGKAEYYFHREALEAQRPLQTPPCSARVATGQDLGHIITPISLKEIWSAPFGSLFL